MLLRRPWKCIEPNLLIFEIEYQFIIKKPINHFCTCGKSIEMPTIFLKRGWRVFFYSNEGTEQMHIHAIKGETEVKYWISQKLNMISYANSFNLKPMLQREIEEILIEQLPRIINTWNIYFNYYQ